MQKARWQKNLAKTVLTILVVVVAVPVVVICTAGLMLHSGAAGNILHKAIDKYVDAEVTYSSIKGSVLHLPKLTVEVQDLLVTYPHERFDSLYVNKSSLSMEGRGEVSDTLLFVKEIEAGLNILELMKGTIWISFAQVHGFKAYLHQYGQQTANWNIFNVPPSKDEDKKGFVPTIMLKHVDIGDDDSRIVFCTHKNVLSTAIDFQKCWVEKNGHLMDVDLAVMAYAQKGNKSLVSAPLAIETSVAAKNRFGTYKVFISELSANLFGIPFEADGRFVIGSETTTMTVDASVPNCNLGALLEKYSDFIPEVAEKISTDVVFSVNIDSKGTFSTLHKIYPTTSFSIRIPDSNISYRGVLENGRVNLDVDGVMSAANVFDVNLKKIGVSGYGVDLNASAKASDLFGKGMKFSVDLNSKIDLEPLLAFIMGSNKVFDAKGTLDLNVTAKDITRKHLQIPGFKEADVNAEINGDILNVIVPGQDITAHISHPHIVVRTLDSQMVNGERALGALVKADSLGARLNGQYIKGKNVSVMAQNAVGDINDTTLVPPFSLRIIADMLALRGEDSLSLATIDTDNRFVIKPVSVEGRDVPDISLESSSKKLAYISSSNRIALFDVNLNATARKRAFWTTPNKKNNFSQGLAGADSSYVPDFLKEKDFVSADINFSLAKSFQKIMSEWNPSCRLEVGNGVLYFSAYPVNNRVRNLEFVINPSFAEIHKTTVLSGNSDITLQSRLSGIRKMMTGKGRGMLNFDVDVISKRMDLNEILSTLQASKSTRETLANAQTLENVEQIQNAFDDTLSMAEIKDSAARGYPLIIVPANLNASISVRGDSLKYAGFDFSSVSADLNMRKRCLQLSDFKASSNMGSVCLDAYYSTVSKDSINIGYDLSLSDVTAGKVIELIPKVGETVPILNSFKGILDFDLTVTSKIDTNMNFITPTMTGVAEINGKNLIIEDLGSMKKVAKLLKFKDKAVGHIDDMNIKAIIGDNQLEIFPFMLGVDRYQLALTGSQVFPNDFIYHISVIKSPLPFKLGVKIYGNSFKSVKYHLEKPKYTSTVLPLFDSQVDNLQLNLIRSIKNIFDRGVDAAVEEARVTRQSIARRKENMDNDGILSREEFEQIELQQIISQNEEEDELLNREIEQILMSI